MNVISMNGYLWKIIFVDPDSIELMDQTGRKTLAVTIPSSFQIKLSKNLYGSKLLTVLIHELAHCAIVSFNLLPDIHRMVKEQYWTEAEEWTCNFIANYGMTIFKSAYSIVGIDAWIFIPQEIEKLIA